MSDDLIVDLTCKQSSTFRVDSQTEFHISQTEYGLNPDRERVLRHLCMTKKIWFGLECQRKEFMGHINLKRP